MFLVKIKAPSNGQLVGGSSGYLGAYGGSFNSAAAAAQGAQYAAAAAAFGTTGFGASSNTVPTASGFLSAQQVSWDILLRKSWRWYSL